MARRASPPRAVYLAPNPHRAPHLPRPGAAGQPASSRLSCSEPSEGSAPPAPWLGGQARLEPSILLGPLRGFRTSRAMARRGKPASSRLSCSEPSEGSAPPAPWLGGQARLAPSILLGTLRGFRTSRALARRGKPASSRLSCSEPSEGSAPPAPWLGGQARLAPSILLGTLRGFRTSRALAR